MSDGDDSTIDPIACQVVRIARDAGAAIMAIYVGNDTAVNYKSDASPVTAADLAANAVICAQLARLPGGYPIISEEGGLPDVARLDAKRVWLVDPLDGTKEYLRRSGEFTVNIALIEDGRPLLGVVHAPAMNLTYFGIVGIGAWCSRAGARSQEIHVTEPAPTEARVVASLNHAGPHLPVYLAALGPHRSLSMGSSLKLCLVAEGAADVYPRLGPTMEWDTAAADAVVRGAGGQVVGPDGSPLRYNKPDLHNPWFVACGSDASRWLTALPPSPHG